MLTNHAPPTMPGSAHQTLGFPLKHPLFWLLALALAHVVLRVNVSPALKWDEAEQMLWSQQLAWGYGAQPPLYTWLQWAVNQVFGPGLLALSLLKQALLVLSYVLLWQAARLFLDRRGAWWAAASMILVPTLGWRTVTDLAHTVLLLTSVAATWLVLLRLVHKPRPAVFALLGAVCAMGMLAKYSFALIAVAMLLAALSEPTTRRALFAPGWWWAPLVGAALLLPHALWLATHWQQATALTVSKMQGQQPGTAAALYDLGGDLFTNLLPFALLALASFGSAWWRRPQTPVAPWVQRLFIRYFICIVVALAGMAMMGGIAVFKARWIAPMLCIVPLAAFCLRPELQEHAHGRRYTLSLVCVALLILLGASMQSWVDGLRGHTGRLTFPIVALEQTLRDNGYHGEGPIIASDHLLAGMLKTRFPQAPVAACPWTGNKSTSGCVATTAQRLPATKASALLVTCDQDAPHAWWAAAAAGLPEAAGVQPAQAIALPYRMAFRQHPPRIQCRYTHWHPAKSRP